MQELCIPQRYVWCVLLFYGTICIDYQLAASWCSFDDNAYWQHDLGLPLLNYYYYYYFMGTCLDHHQSSSLTHSLPGATTHAVSWPTQEAASNHLYLWPWRPSSWLPTSLHPSSLHQSTSGLAFLLVLSKVIFLHGRLSCIHITCPAHLSLVILIVVTRSASSYKRYSSSLYLDLHIAFSHMGP